ncbi:D-3-phosphoglycerate dehydrogenase [Phakopsora pachyrhizi]|uniref:D-3-phosphoglycerate dehydrogenase n=1 Tax=Phakopsora pachyrhizi TaxID=170000 RepID=A0AAV0AM23_PHAPC|nr:D-3-phosphoglycerate dehydrogenase [Phakopsora pachyrhizi]
MDSTDPTDNSSNRSNGTNRPTNLNETNQHSRNHTRDTSLPKIMTPWAMTTTKILLLENINQVAAQILNKQGYVVDQLKTSLSEEDLIERLKSGEYSGLGIRSKTKVTERVIREAGSKLLVIGCFCIGTNQVNLQAAASAGISVFNSPFSNSRSVAELVISELIALSRQLFDRSDELHRGIWNKVSKGCWEVRGKVLGIIGYGHIGTQLSVLAEALGMIVIYYDVVPIMPLGSARQIEGLEEMLSQADFVTIHVPELPETIDMISAKELASMKKNSYLINNSRGKVVDIPALIESLESNHLAGAAIDVFPDEPGSNGENFNDGLNSWFSRLSKIKNVILTPHIGGSTEEAQRAIGAEVGNAFVRYLNFGSSLGAVNFPEVSLRPILEPGLVRVCHVHQNQPGVLKTINSIVSDFNVEKQYSDSKSNLAYLLADIQVSDIQSVSQMEIFSLFDRITNTTSNLKTRILY